MKKLILGSVLISGIALASISSAFAASDPCAGLAHNWHADNKGIYKTIDLTILPDQNGASVKLVTAHINDGAGADYKSCSVVGGIPMEKFSKNIPGLGIITMEAKLMSKTTIQYNMTGFYTVPEITMTKAP